MNADQPAERPQPRSQADEALHRAIRTPAEKASPLPTDPAARRRAMTVRGW